MKFSKNRLRQIIKEEVDNWHLEKMALAKEARFIAKQNNDRKLQALAHALELSLNNGIVMAQGSPFYGMPTQEIEKEIAILLR